MVGKLIQPEIQKLLDERNFAALKEIFQDWPPADLAELIPDLPEDVQVVLFRVVPQDLAAETFEYLELETQKHLLKAMGRQQVVSILNEMSPDDRTALLEELPSTAVTQLLRLLTPEERSIAKSLLGYPEGSVGRLMTPDFIAVPDQWTVQQVLDYIREHGEDSETLNVIYVADRQGKLLNDIRIREFLLRPLDATVASIETQNVLALRVTDSKEEAVKLFRKYDRNTLPVIDSRDIMVGIVTIDDVMDVAEEAATEDIQKFGGLEALERPYMHLSLLEMVQKRAGWLTVLFFGQLLTATAMGLFEAQLQQAVVLALFIPLIISSGGNSGSQAATLVVRALALEEVQLSDWWRVIRRELVTGLLLGTILGVLGVLRIGIGSAISDTYGSAWPLLALTIGLSLISVVIWGTLCGAFLPFLLKRLRLDPATSSTPLVATLVDVTGLVLYFSIALAVLSGTML